MDRLVLVFCTALAASLAVTWAARRAISSYDRRSQRALTRRRPPALGGIVLLAAVFLSVVGIYFGEWGMEDVLRDRGVYLLIGSAIICGVGTVNDWREIRGRYMLLGQLVAVGAVLMTDLSIPMIRVFNTTVELGLWGKLGTAVVLLVMINAFRLLEPMEGVVACLGLVITATLAVMANLRGQPAAVAASSALAGALIGFLWFNFPPAKVRMGTAGAMLVGLLLGVVATARWLKGATAIALMVPAALMAVPFFDLAAAVLRSRLERRGLYTKDQSHLYDCLRRRGLSDNKVLVVISALTLLTAAGALVSQMLQSPLYAVISVLAVAVILVVSRLLGYSELTLLGRHLQATARFLLPKSTPSQALPAAGEINWHQFWNELIERCTQTFHLKEVSIAVDGLPGSGFHASWGVSGNGTGIWKAEFPLAVKGHRAGSLAVTGYEDERPIREKVSDLARLVLDLEGQIGLGDPSGAATSAAPVNDHANGIRRDSGVHLVQATRLAGECPTFSVNVSRLRVCHLGKYYPPASGGIETHVQTLAQAQAAMGTDVRVICVNHVDPNGTDSTWKRFGRTRTVVDHDGPVQVLRVGRWATLARLDVCPEIASVLRRLMDDPPHILHLHTPNPTMLLALAGFCPAVPLVITHHSDIVKQRFLHYPFSVFERLAYRRAARLLTDSPTYAGGSQVLTAFCSKVRPLPLGLNLAPYMHPNASARAFAEHVQERFQGPLWLVVGRLTYYKAIHIALEALVHTPGTLMVIGIGPLGHKLRDRAAELGVADRVAWMGYVSPDELAGAYLAASALWFPSNARSEAFGLVQVEAMAAGCPVINADVPYSGVTWVCPHEITGLTVALNDPGALAAAARRLLDEPRLRIRLIAAGRRRAEQEFSREVMARRSLDIYRDVLECEARLPESEAQDAGELEAVGAA
jgi:rhamnosyl/mannosyltransferase